MSETELERHRTMLWRLCYRMTGSAADADDVVQDTFERALTHPPRDRERDLKPWLVQVALNLGRDQLRRRKRAPYVGPWLPSPIESEGLSLEPLPDARYSELESVSMAFLVALEALTSAQRAVVLLCDVLGYSVREAAQALTMTESNVKTTHHRARAALSKYDTERVPFDKALQARTQLALARLVASLTAGHVEKLAELLSSDVTTVNDSDGEFYAARIPIHGRDRVIKFHLKLRRTEPAHFAIREINGLPAIVGEFASAPPHVARRMVVLIALNHEGQVSQLNSTVASRKLTHVRFQFPPASEPFASSPSG